MGDAKELLKLFKCTKKGFIQQAGDSSLIQANIQRGDILIVDPDAVVTPGHLISAVLPDGQKGCWFYIPEEKGQIRLRHSHPEWEDIIVSDCEIRGAIVGVVREFPILAKTDKSDQKDE